MQDSTDSGRWPSLTCHAQQHLEGAPAPGQPGAGRRMEGFNLQRSQEKDSTSVCPHHLPGRTPPLDWRTRSPGSSGWTEARQGEITFWRLFSEACLCLESLAFPEHGLGQTPCHCHTDRWPREEFWVPCRAVLQPATQLPRLWRPVPRQLEGSCPSHKSYRPFLLPVALRGPTLRFRETRPTSPHPVPAGHTPEGCGATDPPGGPCGPASPEDIADTSA